MPTSYVFCASLHHVQDVFNVENLWTRAKRKHPDGQFLQEALEQNPRTQRNRHQSQTYFSHIIVQIPNADYLHDEDLHAGAGTQMLLADLREYHQQKLKQYVAPGEEIRYRIEPHPALLAGDVRFRFGPAIYLPPAGETPVDRIYRQTDANNQELGVIYPDQRLTLLNGDPDGSTFLVPDWPFGAEASLLLRLKPAPGMGLEVAARPEHSLIVTPLQATTRRRYEIRNAAGASLTLMLAPYNATVVDLPIEEPTWMPGGDLPGSQPRLRVVGAALQRLSSRSPAGLLAWRLAFNGGGQLVPCRDPSVAACLRIDVEDKLWGEADQHSVPLVPPTEWSPQDGLTLQLNALPEALQQDYLGWLRLPQPIPLNLAVGCWCCFGRGQDADLTPALFDDSEAWQWAKDQAPIKHPEQLLLSRRHVHLRADPQGWTMKLASTHWPIYLLDTAGALHQTLAPADGGREQYAAQGTLLIVGGYVLELG